MQTSPSPRDPSQSPPPRSRWQLTREYIHFYFDVLRWIAQSIVYMWFTVATFYIDMDIAAALAALAVVVFTYFPPPNRLGYSTPQGKAVSSALTGATFVLGNTVTFGIVCAVVAQLSGLSRTWFRVFFTIGVAIYPLFLFLCNPPTNRYFDPPPEGWKHTVSELKARLFAGSLPVHTSSSSEQSRDE